MDSVVERFLIPKFHELGMSATGNWLQSLETEARGNTGVIRGQDYSYYLVNGRRPGARPPIAPIEQWVNDKLGISGSQGLGIAFAVANKIAQEGTSWYEKGGSDLLEVLESEEVVNFIRNEYRNLVQIQVKAEIQRTIKTIMK